MPKWEQKKEILPSGSCRPKPSHLRRTMSSLTGPGGQEAAAPEPPLECLLSCAVSGLLHCHKLLGHETRIAESS